MYRNTRGGLYLLSGEIRVRWGAGEPAPHPTTFSCRDLLEADAREVRHREDRLERPAAHAGGGEVAVVAVQDRSERRVVLHQVDVERAVRREPLRPGQRGRRLHLLPVQEDVEEVVRVGVVGAPTVDADVERLALRLDLADLDAARERLD